MEFLKIIACVIGTSLLAGIIGRAVEVWYEFPLKEEKSTPIYITKIIE